MKSFVLLAGVFLLSASAALAQTVLPSGAVAPAGAVIAPSGVPVTPGTVPGSQPLANPALRDAGRPQGHLKDQKAPGMNHQDKKRLRKMSKVKPSSE